MKSVPSILSVCFAVVCVAGTVVLVSGFRSNRDLREANQELAAELRATQARTDTLLAGNQETARQLALLGKLAEDLKARIAEMEIGRTKEAEETVPTVIPYQIQAYLGKTFLGRAWIIPRNLWKDPNTQRYVYEPVVWLPESLRKGFVTHHTNVVEREVEKQIYVNTTYYPQPVYYVSYPFHHRPATNYCPPTPQPPAAPLQPIAPRFNPGSGTVIAPEIGMRAGQIKTRPQVLGTRADSIKTFLTSNGTGPTTP
jgi:hypothetical protein